MTTTPILGITQVAASQNQKEVTINDGVSALEQAANAVLVVSFAAGAVTLSSLQFTRSAAFRCTAATAATTLTVPLTPRVFLVINQTAYAIAVQGATGTGASVAPNSVAAVCCDATNVYASTAAAIDYPNLPAEVQNLPYSVFIPGVGSAAQLCLLAKIVQSTTIPANFTGSDGYCGTAATASTSYTVSYIRAGTTTVIGTFSFAAGSSTPTLSTQAAVSLAAGDVLKITGQSTADTTLADVAITLLTKKV